MRSNPLVDTMRGVRIGVANLNHCIQGRQQKLRQRFKDAFVWKVKRDEDQVGSSCVLLSLLNSQTCQYEHGQRVMAAKTVQEQKPMVDTDEKPLKQWQSRK